MKIRVFVSVQQPATPLKNRLEHGPNKLGAQAEGLQGVFSVNLPDFVADAGDKNRTGPCASLVEVWPTDLHSNGLTLSVRSDFNQLQCGYGVHMFGQRSGSPIPSQWRLIVN